METCLCVQVDLSSVFYFALPVAQKHNKIELSKLVKNLQVYITSEFIQ